MQFLALLIPYYRKPGECGQRNVSLYCGFFWIWGVFFRFCFWGGLGFLWVKCVNVLKITSGKQNVTLDWFLFRLFIDLYALCYILGKSKHILPWSCYLLGSWNSLSKLHWCLLVLKYWKSRISPKTKYTCFEPSFSILCN